MLFKSQSTESAPRAAPKDFQEREQFQGDFESRYMYYYKNRAWSELKQFLEHSISAVDKTSSVPYAKRAEYLINYNASLVIGINENFPTTKDLEHGTGLSYPNIVSNLIVPLRIRLYRGKPPYGIPEIDSLLVKYNLYTTLFTHLADVFINTEQYNVALERMFHLGLVCHYIRLDLFNAVNILGSSSEGPVAVFNRIKEDLQAIGIRVDGAANIISSKDILNHIIDYWCQEVSIEIWSRFVKIWLGDSSPYVVVSKINSLPVSRRSLIFASIELDFAHDSKSLDNVDYFVYRANKRANFGQNSRSVFGASYILQNILKSPFSNWSTTLEGFVFVAQFSRDTDFNAYCFLYKVLHNISRLYFTVVGMYELVNAHSDKWGSIVYKHVGLKGVKATFKIPQVFHIIDYQNSINAVFTCGPLLNLPIYIRYREQCSVANMDLNMPLGGVAKYLHLSKPSFEAQVWLDLYNFTRVDVDHCDLVHMNVKNRSGYCTVSRVDDKLDLNVGDFPPFLNVPIDGIVVDVYLKFNKMGFRLNRRHDLSGFMLDSVLVCGQQIAPIVKGMKDSVIFSLIAFCFVLDKMPTILNYMQCNEYLQFRNPFSRRRRVCCGCLKYRANPPVSSMLTFQRYIRGVFKHKVLGICSGTKGSSHIGALKQKSLEDLGEKKTFATRLGFPDGLKFFLKKSRVTYGSKQAYLVHNVDHLKGTIKGFVLSLKRQRKAAHVLGPLTIENMDDVACTDAKRCIHQFFHRGSLCTEPPWQHLNHLVVVLDWLCHYSFTSSISAHLILPTSHTTEAEKSLAFSKSSSFILLQDESMDRRQVFVESLFRALKRCDVLSEFQPAQMSCLYILNELLENAILFSQATFFNQGHYKALVARLALVQLYQGRWNLAIQLFKQAIVDSDVLYKVGCTPGIVDDSNVVAVGSMWDSHFCFDENTIRLVMAKVILELSRTPHAAVPFLKPLLDHEKVGPSVAAKANMAMALHILATPRNCMPYTFAESLEPFEKFYAIPNVSQLVTTQESHALLSRFGSVTTEAALSEFFSIDGTSEVTISPLDSERSQHPSVGKTTPEKTEAHILARAMEHMLQCVTLDPLDYKGWLVLAQVALLGHDFWFSRRCALQSIDLCNDCLGSWLTLAVVSSCRVKTCAPMNCQRDLWLDYINDCKTNNDVCTIESAPIPFDCAFETDIVTKSDLKLHLSRGVGGDVGLVLQRLHSLRVHKSAFIASAFVELAAIVSEYYSPRFSWEGQSEETPRQSSARSGRSSLLKRVTSIGTSRRLESRGIRELVSKIVDANKFICCVPFLNCFANMLIPGTGVFECLHHHQHQPGANCSDGVLDYKVLQEELHGWICFLECCTRLGYYQIAHELLPIPKGYLKIYNLKRTSDGIFTSYNDNRAGVETCAHVRGRYTEHSFSGDACFAATSLNLQLECLQLEIATHYCFNMKGLTKVLYDIQDACKRSVFRPLELLQIRVMVGLKMYKQATALCARTFSRGFVADFSTDYNVEGLAREAYAVALSKCGHAASSKFQCAFAQVLHKTAPALKLSHCLLLGL